MLPLSRAICRLSKFRLSSRDTPIDENRKAECRYEFNCAISGNTEIYSLLSRAHSIRVSLAVNSCSCKASACRFNRPLMLRSGKPVTYGCPSKKLRASSICLKLNPRYSLLTDRQGTNHMPSLFHSLFPLLRHLISPLERLSSTFLNPSAIRSRSPQ